MKVIFLLVCALLAFPAHSQKVEGLSEEHDRLDKLAIAYNYAGYAKTNLIGMMYQTQSKGGIETFLNKVVGCPVMDSYSCDRWYPSVKISQVLDDWVLYEFSEYQGRSHLGFSILVAKQPGKMYYDGQSLLTEPLVFVGVMSIETVLGATRTIPAFRLANISSEQWNAADTQSLNP